MASILKSLDETQLRSLKFSEFTGREPFVLKSIDTKLESRVNLQQQVTKRAEDLVRITKLLASRPGLKFIANTSLLTLSENTKKSEKLDLRSAAGRRSAGQAAFQTAKSVGSTLATILLQVPVSGTGIRFSADELAGTTYYRNKFFSFKGQSTTELRNPNGNFVTGDSGQEKQLSRESTLVDIKSFEGFEDKPYLQRNQQKVTELEEQKILQNTIDVKLRMGGPTGGRKTELNTDSKNYQVVTTEPLEIDEDIIPFKIEVKDRFRSYFIYFRAYLEDLSDNFRGEWNSFKYVGRGEPFYNYTGFDRSLGFSFKIAATSRAELIPLYQKLNYLVGSTAPHYNTQFEIDPVSEETTYIGTFMGANYVVLTIGDYLVEVPGFFESIDVSWDKSYPWEIKRGRPGEQNENQVIETEDIKILPHILDVRVNFKPIHNFLPQFKQPFIGNISNMENPDIEQLDYTYSERQPRPEPIQNINTQVPTRIGSGPAPADISKFQIPANQPPKHLRVPSAPTGPPKINTSNLPTIKTPPGPKVVLPRPPRLA
jgi:hypothetical protein